MPALPLPGATLAHGLRPCLEFDDKNSSAWCSNLNCVFDAAVVGAGPAGSMAAYQLARAGVRVLLLEKETAPRYKPCAGGLTPKTVQEVPFDLDDLVEDVCQDFQVSLRLGQPFRRRYPHPMVYMVMRDRFDQYLTERAVQAGVVLRDGSPATGVELRPVYAEVRTKGDTFRVAALVGADGANGVVARSLGLGSDFHHWVAWESEVVPDDVDLERWRGLIGIDLGTLRGGGYAWVFPKRDLLSVGAGGCTQVGRDLRGYCDRFVAGLGLRSARALRQRGHLLPIRPRGSPIQLGRALLAGDAAGLVDASTGEGIYWAVRSGKLAASAVLELLAGEIQDLESYERRVDDELMPELLAARRWVSLYLWAPALCSLLIHRSDPFWQTICMLFRGDQGYQDVARLLGPLRFLPSLLPEVDGKARHSAMR